MTHLHPRWCGVKKPDQLDVNNWGYSTDNILRINCHEIIMGGAIYVWRESSERWTSSDRWFFFSHEVLFLNIIDCWKSLVYYNLWKGHLVVPRRSQRIAWLTILIACVLEKENKFCCLLFQADCLQNLFNSWWVCFLILLPYVFFCWGF